MIVESVLAFALIICASLVIYAIGRRAAPKIIQTEAERSVYACGEKISYPKLRVNVSLYKYLIYFVILDSSVLLLAFGSFMGQVNVPLILVYLFVLLASTLLLMDGGKD